MAHKLQDVHHCSKVLRFVRTDVHNLCPYVTTHFSASVLTYQDWLWWIRLRSQGWLVGFSHALAVLQITVSFSTGLPSII